MTRVADLRPGDVVRLGHFPLPSRIIFIARTEHPIWPHLELVVWRHADATHSLDALAKTQDVGEVEMVSATVRDRRLKTALAGGGKSWTEVF